jgi:hypothetical protein
VATIHRQLVLDKGTPCLFVCGSLCMLYSNLCRAILVMRVLVCCRVVLWLDLMLAASDTSYACVYLYVLAANLCNERELLLFCVLPSTGS